MLIDPRSNYEKIPDAELRHAVVKLADALEGLLQDYIERTGGTGEIMSRDDGSGYEVFWCGPTTPGEEYPAVTWTIANDKIECRYLDGVTDVSDEE
jgi:hypothetical protein